MPLNKPQLRQLPTDQRGFTVAELLVTVVVFSIVLASFAGLFYVLQITQVQSQHYDIAVRAARTEIEDLRNNGYESLTPGNNINFTASLPTSLPPSRSGTVTVSSPAAGLIRLDATITYTDYGKAETVTLSSDIGIIGITQGH